VKKGNYVRNFIKGLLMLLVSIACKILSSFMSAKAVTTKEKVLIDHLNGNYDSPLVEIVYKYGEIWGRMLSVMGIIFLLFSITFIVTGIIKIISERKNKRSKRK
jgi:putative effector of murein hydrolase LrgA (UPF0299 family)